MTELPNILFLFPDQLSARWLEDARVMAPNLDAFAQTSVQFARAYTNCPICTPYRACLFTGKYPTQTGVMRNGMSLPDGERTIADAFNDAGYSTHYIGKWHLSGSPQCNRWVPPEQRGGFQNFIGWESHHVDHFAGKIWRDDPDSAIALEGHETDGLTDIVCDEISKLGPEPFFMTVAFQAPHPPCSPPDEFIAMYAGKDLCNDENADRDAWFLNKSWNADYGTQEFRERYFGEITHLDTAFSRILEALESAGLADSTIVIFTSDHGETAGAHGIFGKGVMYDEAVRVPLLIRMPGKAGRTVSTPVATVDLHATLLALASIDTSDGEGRSFADVLLEPTAHTPPAPVFIDYKERCVIDGDWKLTVNRETAEAVALFNRKNDPREIDNLVDDPMHSEQQKDLLACLQDFVAGLEQNGIE